MTNSIELGSLHHHPVQGSEAIVMQQGRQPIDP